MGIVFGVQQRTRRSSARVSFADVLVESTRRTPRFGAAPFTDVGEGGWPPTQEYANRIDHYVLALNKDAKEQIVFDDPFVISSMLKKAKEGGDVGELTVPILEKYLAAALAKVKNRGGEEQAKRDLAWAARWSPFLVEWNAWHEKVHSFSPGIPATQAWEKQENFEARLRELYGSFLELGGTHVTEPLPATLTTATGKPDPGGYTIPWKPLLWIGGAIGAGYLISSVTGVFRG